MDLPVSAEIMESSALFPRIVFHIFMNFAAVVAPAFFGTSNKKEISYREWQHVISFLYRDDTRGRIWGFPHDRETNYVLPFLCGGKEFYEKRAKVHSSL